MKAPLVALLPALVLALAAACDGARGVRTDPVSKPDRTTRDASSAGPRDGSAACEACAQGGADARASIAADASFGDARDASPDGSLLVEGGSFPLGYPRGPYRALVGGRITDLKWQGYVNATAVGFASTAPFTAYSMDDVRRSGHALAFVHVSDFDCPGCNHAANDLGQLGKGIVDMGVTVVEVLASHAFSLPATRAYLDAWVSSHDLTVTSVIDADSGLDTLTTVGVRETALLIDLNTMKIVWRFEGDLGGTDPSSVTFTVAELKRRLGD